MSDRLLHEGTFAILILNNFLTIYQSSVIDCPDC